VGGRRRYHLGCAKQHLEGGVIDVLTIVSRDHRLKLTG
jgi:hypothetical protein